MSPDVYPKKLMILIWMKLFNSSKLLRLLRTLTLSILKSFWKNFFVSQHALSKKGKNVPLWWEARNIHTTLYVIEFILKNIFTFVEVNVFFKFLWTFSNTLHFYGSTFWWDGFILLICRLWTKKIFETKNIFKKSPQKSSACPLLLKVAKFICLNIVLLNKFENI